MEDDHSIISIKRSDNYYQLLQNIDEFSKLVTNTSTPGHVSTITDDASAIEKIFEDLTVNIQEMRDIVKLENNEENFKKNAIYSVSILNTIIRVSVIGRFDGAILGKSFQSMFARLIAKLENFIPSFTEAVALYPMLASDMFNSMLLNLAEDNLLQTCFQRLLSNGALVNEGNFFIFAV